MIDWFLPGYKAGGQIQSCANLALALQDLFIIYIITSDRDLGDDAPYPSIQPDAWNKLGNGLEVFYVSPQNLRYSFLKKVTAQVDPHCIYINSMFSWPFTALPLLAYYRNSKAKIVLAPRGMLHAGALSQRKLKKTLFLQVFKAIGLSSKVLFHATNTTEVKDIRQVLGKQVAVKLVQDFNATIQKPFQTVAKERGQLKCLFVARVVRHKNLLFLLLMLKRLTATVSVTVAGPVEEADYWNECQQAISQLPPHITVSHTGAIPHQELEKIYLDHHLFVLPTLGENFGHAIFESLLYGRPVLLSDKTPWHDLQQKEAGWTPALDQDAFLSVIQVAAGWSQQEFDRHASAAWHYAKEYIQKGDLANKYVDLFSIEEPTPVTSARG
ncbi:MAG: glycosyltransferase [Williamsia sp.]|nr:glycosyltransferase [Williamsia sp.]